MRSATAFLTAITALACTACEGPQSALDAAGVEAEIVLRHLVLMVAGAAVVWAAVVALALRAPHARPTTSRPHSLLIVGGGLVVPAIVLTGHLVYGLAQLPALRSLAPDEAPTIEITGVQWWWRVLYRWPDGTSFELANEVWLPVGERVNVRLLSRDVVHSFWVPALAGKLDAIPGRQNAFSLLATRVGTYRGACAEFCGASHARMNLIAEVVDRARFDEWARGQAQPAASAPNAIAEAGERSFAARGCAACHTVRGTLAQGRVGPDLTHVGSRRTIAAGTLPRTRADLAMWIARADTIKPKAHMPAFSRLSDDELAALVAYLMSLT